MLHPRRAGPGETGAARDVSERRANAFSPTLTCDNATRRMRFCYPSPTMAATKLTKIEIEELRSRLEEEQAELQAQLSTLEEDTFAATQSDSAGDVGLDDESADAGSATFEREKDLSIEQNVRDLLQKIERALKRIADGTYGLCERCGKPIEKARIKALPYVDLCIKDAQAQSRR